MGLAHRSVPHSLISCAAETSLKRNLAEPVLDSAIALERLVLKFMLEKMSVAIF